MKPLELILLLLCVKCCHSSKDGIYRENQMEEECGIFDATTHENHRQEPERRVLGTSKDPKNLAHLQLDTTMFNRTWPWQVIIMSDNKYLCNGLLVRTNFVVTTATCLDQGKPSSPNHKYTINVNGLIYEGKAVFIHVGYDSSRPKKMAGDIGLLKLLKRVPFETNMGISPICPPRSRYQLRQAVECAVTYAKFDSETNKTKAFDSPAKIIDNKFCKKNDVTIDGAKKLLLCVAVTKKMKIVCNEKEVMFLMCKSSSFWTIFGQSKLCDDSETNKDKYSYTYYLSLLSYKTWMKDLIGEKKSAKSFKTNKDFGTA